MNSINLQIGLQIKLTKLVSMSMFLGDVSAYCKYHTVPLDHQFVPPLSNLLVKFSGFVRTNIFCAIMFSFALWPNVAALRTKRLTCDIASWNVRRKRAIPDKCGLSASLFTEILRS